MNNQAYQQQSVPVQQNITPEKQQSDPQVNNPEEVNDPTVLPGLVEVTDEELEEADKGFGKKLILTGAALAGRHFFKKHRHKKKHHKHKSGEVVCHIMMNEKGEELPGQVFSESGKCINKEEVISRARETGHLPGLNEKNQAIPGLTPAAGAPNLIPPVTPENPPQTVPGTIPVPMYPPQQPVQQPVPVQNPVYPPIQPAPTGAPNLIPPATPGNLPQSNPQVQQPVPMYSQNNPQQPVLVQNNLQPAAPGSSPVQYNS